MRFGFEIDCKNKQILGIDGDLVTYEFGWWAGETDRSLGGGDGRYATTVSSAYHKNGGTYTLQYANYLAYLNHSVPTYLQCNLHQLAKLLVGLLLTLRGEINSPLI